MRTSCLGILLALVCALPAAGQESGTLGPRPAVQPPLPGESGVVPVGYPPVITTTETAPSPQVIVVEPAMPRGKLPPAEEPPEPVSMWYHGDGMEYLLWWMKGSRVPPLVTSGLGTPPLLGLSSTRSLFGGNDPIDMGERSGGRFTLAAPLLKDRALGLHVTYLFLGTRTVDLLASGTGLPNSASLGRPFLDAITNEESFRPIAFPDLVTGGVQVELSSRVQGWEGNVVAHVYGRSYAQLDLISGFRYFQLDEGLAVHERSVYAPDVPDLGGLTVAAEDRIATHTRFFGGQIGARAEFRHHGLFMNVLAKVAFGQSNEVLRYSGQTILMPAGGTPLVVPTGTLLALSTNLGRATRESFALLPELGLRVGYHMNEKGRFFVGYNLLYLTDVLRPGDQIDRVVNPRLMPDAISPGILTVGPSRPQLDMRSTDFWVQGLTLGFEYTY